MDMMQQINFASTMALFSMLGVPYKCGSPHPRARYVEIETETLSLVFDKDNDCCVSINGYLNVGGAADLPEWDLLDHPSSVDRAQDARSWVRQKCQQRRTQDLNEGFEDILGPGHLASTPEHIIQGFAQQSQCDVDACLEPAASGSMHCDFHALEYQTWKNGEGGIPVKVSEPAFPEGPNVRGWQEEE